MVLSKTKNHSICVVGLGYVGLPLAIAFSEKFKTIAYDTNTERIKELRKGIDKTLEIEKPELDKVKNNIYFTNNIEKAQSCNFYVVTVPTPIDKSNKPDLSPLMKASKKVGSVLDEGDIVVFESTVYPGVTEEICVPELEKSSGLVFNKDFFCGYSPERINPGDKKHTVKNIIKVTSGSTPQTAKTIDAIYNKVITAGTHLASSIKVAEASKVIENTQRDVNIALINELALIFNQMGINTHEILDAASTKWNFIDLRPGLVGGHCIGIDPYYLTYKAEEIGYKPNLILASRQINNGMGKYIADQAIKEMIRADKAIKNSDILILGVTFKENCPDTRNTKVFDILRELRNYGANIDIYDPWVDKIPEKNWDKKELIDNPLLMKKKYDCIIIAVGHNTFKNYTSENFFTLSKGKMVIIDVKNTVKNPTWKL